jgi:alpha-L-fucosidase 2
MRQRTRVLAAATVLLGSLAVHGGGQEIRPSEHDLVFGRLATSWDEGIPLGNGTLGALVWQKDGRLRLSLDRVDLWDLRPMANLDSPEWSFGWVQERWRENDYSVVQEKFDAPYETSPAPTKIPAGAVEFDLAGLGGGQSVRLSVEEAACRVVWPGGTSFECFVHAGEPCGRFRFRGAPAGLRPLLIAPAYGARKTAGADSVTGQDLSRLGYAHGKMIESPGLIVYRQSGWDGFYYEIAVAWRADGHGTIEGAWSISSRFSDDRKERRAEHAVKVELERDFETSLRGHQIWWENFWAKAGIDLPDKVLEKQWYLEQYKFGAAARRGAPPITLQAVWTADNGKLPPWKGDFHHDLNTELSYWPCYSANHLEEGLGFLDWLWELRPEFKRYTRGYFGKGGLAVPGVSTLLGQPMGGWIQYSFSPTIAAWLAQHFDLHWRFSGDRRFLEERAYPWVRDVAVFLDELSVRDGNGRRRLPLSSSPEIFDNRREAWFEKTTNYDLALIKWTFRTAAEQAEELGKKDEAIKWRRIFDEWPDFAVDAQGGLMFAPGFPYAESHRHFSHLMAFHPLGLLDVANGERDEEIIKNTLATLARFGSDWWTGYSFSWLGNLKARALDGEGAAEALRTFALDFCLPNSFHANGDQSKTGLSKFTYRPFTLEGNFAFAAGIQEMLLQSHAGAIRVFPAVPAAWRDASFRTLRARGAFLVSARKSGGTVQEVEVISEKGGTLRLRNPFPGEFIIDGRRGQAGAAEIELHTQTGQRIVFRNAAAVR